MGDGLGGIPMAKEGNAEFDGLILPEAGIYFLKSNRDVITVTKLELTSGVTFTVIDEVVHKLEAKYLPKGISWNDLTDKPFGELLTGGIILELTTETSFHEYSNGVAQTLVDINPPSYSPGKDFCVIFDGKDYICRNFYGGAGGTFYGIGNLALFSKYNFGTERDDLPNSGEPFCWVYFGGNQRLLTEIDGEHTIVVSESEMTKLPANNIAIYTDGLENGLLGFYKGGEELFIKGTGLCYPVNDAQGEYVTAEEFNALLDALRNGGILLRL
jgi:hypothetical protein